MDTLWKREYTRRGSDFDRYNCIKPAAVLDLFQDAAAQHAQELGVGFEDMLRRGYLWVLTRVKFKFLKAPKSYQRVIAKTWPLAPNRLNYRREYCVEDLNGERLIIGSSEWVVIDNVKRRFLSVPDLYPFSSGFYPEVMLEGKLCKIKDFTAAEPAYTVDAGFCDLDLNGHVNNTKYANYFLNAIHPTGPLPLKTFQIDYRKEVVLGTRLHLFYEKGESGFLAKGQNQNGEIMFACRLECDFVNPGSTN